MSQISFLQTPDWEKFQQAAGYTTKRVNNKLLIKHNTPLGHYWYSPRPILTQDDIRALTDFATSDKALFVRIDPQNYLDHNYPKVPAIQPQNSLVMTLEDPKTMLEKFHQKTRYNIRLAEKKEVKVIEYAGGDNGIDAFLSLAAKTAQRQKITLHQANYYKTMLETLGGKPGDGNLKVTIFVAFWVRIPIAANIVLWPGDNQTAYYLHGASDYKYRNAMAPHLIQWHTMIAANQRNYQKYDFWGIAPLEDGVPDEGHPWSGITRFKLGFGGEVVTYPDSFEIITNPNKYKLFKLASRAKKLIRM